MTATTTLLLLTLAAADLPRVNILFFDSAQCPACEKAADALGRLEKEQGTSVAVVRKRISEHPVEANALGVTNTPALFINGRRLDGGFDPRQLARHVDLALGRLLDAEAVSLNLQHSPRLGTVGRHEITVFSDFQCPYCSSVAPVLAELAKSGEASIRFKHYPLSFHTKAPGAHRAAWAAGQQGKFWEMHDSIFAAPARLDNTAYEEHAQKLGLDLPRFRTDLATEPAAIREDLAEGDRVGVQGTPSLFVNGRLFHGRPDLAGLRAALKELGSAAAPARAPQPESTVISGSPQAPVTLEWFFDAHSELTRDALATVRQLVTDSRLQLVARHLPLPFHPASRATHQALVLAHRQGKFWPLLDAVLAQLPAEPDADRLKSLAMRTGLDFARFSSDLEHAIAVASVEQDLTRARTLGVRGVPTFVLNGKPLDGVVSLPALQAAIRQAVEQTKLARSGESRNPR